MLLMLMIPILLTIVPGMLYQSMRLLARNKSTLTHYVLSLLHISGLHLVVGDGVDAVIGLAVLRLGDHALELGGDVVHDHFVQGHAGVIAAGGSLEGVVGVAAGAHKVVGRCV